MDGNRHPALVPFLASAAMVMVMVLALGAAVPAHAKAEQDEAVEMQPVDTAVTDAPQIMPQDVFAPDQSAAQPDPIGAIIILGNAALPDSNYQAALESYFGMDASEEMLARLLNEIAQIAKDEGYSYATSAIAPGGALGGVWQIVVDEGRVDEVRVEGYANARALAILRGLEGGFAHRPALERALLQIGDIPAVRLRSAKFHREGEGQSARGVLVVGLERVDASYRIEADNYGTDSFGPWRARLSTWQTDVLTSSDELSAAIRLNPVDLDELLFFSASYGVEVTAGGPRVELAGSVGNTVPGGAFRGSDLTGDSSRLALSVTQALIVTRNARLWGEAQVAYLAIEQEALDTILRSDTVVTAAVGLRGQMNFGDTRVRAGLRYERGLDLLGATRRGALLASRSDGDGVFSKLEGWLDARLDINSRVEAYLLARGQLADRPLLASQELALGGAYSVRGYDFSEVLGDEGLYGLAELRYRVPTQGIPLDALQFYAFADGGYVADIGRAGGGGSLFSAGPGLRARLGPLNLELESAFPLGGSADRSEDSDPEVSLRAGVNF